MAWKRWWVITGGCNGLAQLLVETFGPCVVGVAALDVREPEDGKEKMEEKKAGGRRMWRGQGRV
jgi:hypothetical protein